MSEYGKDKSNILKVANTRWEAFLGEQSLELDLLFAPPFIGKKASHFLFLLQILEKRET